MSIEIISPKVSLFNFSKPTTNSPPTYQSKSFSASSGNAEGIALSTNRSFAVVEGVAVNMATNTNGASMGQSGYDAQAWIKLRFKKTGYEVDLAFSYYSGLTTQAEPNDLITNFLLVCSKGSARLVVNTGGVQIINNVGIDPSNGFELVAKAVSNTTHASFSTSAIINATGTIKVF